MVHDSVVPWLAKMKHLFALGSEGYMLSTVLILGLMLSDLFLVRMFEVILRLMTESLSMQSNTRLREICFFLHSN